MSRNIKNTMKKYIFFLPFLLILLLPTTSLAKEIAAVPSTLKITPVIIPLQLLPSQTISIPIKVQNISSIPQPLRASFSDFDSTGEDGSYDFKQTSSNPLLAWSSISPQEIIIPAHQEETVTLTVKTPNRVPVGGYFGMLFFEPVPQAQVTKDATQIVPRIGVLLLGSVGIQDKIQTNIETFTLPELTDKSTYPSLLRIKNTGLQYTTVKPIITVTSLWENPKRITLEDKVVFPDKIRRWEEVIQSNHMWDISKVILAVSNGNGQITTKEQLVIVMPYRVLLMNIVGFMVIVFVCLKRKNIKKAFSILLKGDTKNT